jgi:N-acetylmuramic acid 6-phosphate etherase
MLNTFMSPVNYATLATEQRNPKSTQLDFLSVRAFVRLMNREDARVLQAVSKAQGSISQAILLIAKHMKSGGRLFFVGAGTSGRLGVLEAAECPPTFNTSPTLIQAIMAGGAAAVFRSKEGSEDSQTAAATLVRRKIRRNDVVVGVAASGVTPFVKTALKRSRAQKAKTILVTCNPLARETVDVRIVLPTGPEVLTGSTRLKAGTACKMALNMLTTGAMIQLGKVYGNRMVDLQPKSHKLVERGLRLLQDLTGCSRREAQRLFRKARGHVKVAVVMAQKKLSYSEASKRLSKSDGYLRKALA